MKIQTKDGVLTVSEIGDIASVKAGEFRDMVGPAITADIQTVEIDLTATRFVDSDGLGAFFAIYKSAQSEREDRTLRLLNPRPAIQQLFELTQLHQLYEISRR
jgi:anti-anti-sigma factor